LKPLLQVDNIVDLSRY